VCTVIKTDKLCLVMCLVAMSVHGSLSCDVERDALEGGGPGAAEGNLNSGPQRGMFWTYAWRCLTARDELT
jgi:hypothetical protein